MTLRLYHFGFVLLFVGACSWLVESDEGPIKCRAEKGVRDPCPQGTSCMEGECRAWQGCRAEVCGDRMDNDCDNHIDEQSDVAEECNDQDDDCDGMIDEHATDELCDNKDNDCDGEVDEGHDPDGDGYTWCGDLTLDAEKDCETLDSNAHPGRPEVCDGLNNDCDEDTDEGTCPASSLCSRTGCVPRTCAVPGSGFVCPATERCIDDVCVKVSCGVDCKVCDQKTNVCMEVAPQPHKNGDSCTLDSDCLVAEHSFCVDSAVFRLAAPAPRRICAKACCSDAECAANETCFAAGSGARSCLPRTLALNLTSTGAAQRTCASEACASPPAACAPQESAQGSNRLVTPVCRAPASGERQFSEYCDRDLDCASRLCIPLLLSSVCSAPCGTSASCARLSQRAGVRAAYCQYVELGQYSLSSFSNNFASICLAHVLENPPSKPANNACSSNAQCPDGTCLGAASNKPGQCAPVCCTDDHCSSIPNARCLPVARGTGRFEMRCVVPTAPR